jgi:predicted amidohydrolase
MQFHRPSPKRLTTVAALACAAALIPAAALAATASPAAPATAARASASATGTPVISVNSATLVANGAAVQVVVTVTCGAGDTGNVSLTTTQAVGVRVAQAAPSFGFTCTGKPQRESELAAANVNGAPFRLGTALVQASVADCPGANCTEASTNRVLSIGK